MNKKNIEKYQFQKRSAGEVRKANRKGGINSGKTRRKKRDIKLLANAILSAQAPSNAQKVMEKMSIDDDSNATAILLKQFENCMKGDTKSAEFLFNYAGQKPKEELEIDCPTEIKIVNDFEDVKLNTTKHE